MGEDVPFSLCVADALRPGLPLVYVNDKFVEMSGYAKREVLGHNCRFLQGPASEVAAINALKASVQVTYSSSGSASHTHSARRPLAKSR